jgi:carboxylesterase type B
VANIATANITAAGLVILESLAQIGETFSEDCLTLNVWTKPQTGEPFKAVLVWIYGGSFATGSSAETGYNGQFIADLEDVVLVSFKLVFISSYRNGMLTLNSYRTNIFGFPGAPNTAQNLGLLDQRLAVEWGMYSDLS